MNLRFPNLRPALHPFLSNPYFHQRRWARVHDVRFLVTHGSQQNIMLRYRDKLESKARLEGKKDIDELKEQYKGKIDQLRKQAMVPGVTGPFSSSPPANKGTGSEGTSVGKDQLQSSPWPAPPPPPLTAKEPPSAAAPPGVKTLSSFLDLTKVRSLPEKEVQALWHLQHASDKQSIHFVVPATTFSSLLKAAQRHPSFVLPLPKEIPKEGLPEGSASNETQAAAELHYLQFAFPHDHTTTLIFTSLAEFKLRGEFASPHTTITFHQELADTHHLVLGQGTVVDNRGVSPEDARWLVMCMQKFYIQTDEGAGRLELLQQFTRGDTAFRIEKLLDEAEKLL